jgi:hypothetical protein
MVSALPVAEVLRWMEVASGVAVVVATLELLVVRARWTTGGPWAWSQVAGAFPPLDALLGDAPFTGLVMLRMVGAMWLCVAPGAWPALLVWGTSLLVNVRLRGPWNGGSDHMLFIVVTAIALAELGRAREVVVQGAVAWVGVQAILSYTIAGLAKLRSAAWRRGTALPGLLGIPAYGVPAGMKALVAQPGWARLGAWGVLAFECAFPLVLLGPRVALAGVAVAAFFHLGNAWTFGLNRFLLTWAATWPAILWIAERTGAR